MPNILDVLQQLAANVQQQTEAEAAAEAEQERIAEQARREEQQQKWLEETKQAEEAEQAEAQRIADERSARLAELLKVDPSVVALLRAVIDDELEARQHRLYQNDF